MSQESSEPLRGEAAYRAAKQRVEKANEAAYARGREERAADAAEAAARRRQTERQGMKNLPTQPPGPCRPPRIATSWSGWRPRPSTAARGWSSTASAATAARPTARGCASCSAQPTPRKLASRPPAPASGGLAHQADEALEPDVAAGDEHADACALLRPHVAGQQRRGRDRAARLGDELEVVEQERHRGEDLVVAAEDHVVDELAHDLERPLARLREHLAVGDVAGHRDLDPLAGLQRALDDAGRLDADHARARVQRLDHGGAPAQQPAAADRGEQQVELAGVLEQLERGG